MTNNYISELSSKLDEAKDMMTAYQNAVDIQNVLGKVGKDSNCRIRLVDVNMMGYFADFTVNDDKFPKTFEALNNLFEALKQDLDVNLQICKDSIKEFTLNGDKDD